MNDKILGELRITQINEEKEIAGIVPIGSNTLHDIFKVELHPTTHEDWKEKNRIILFSVLHDLLSKVVSPRRKLTFPLSKEWDITGSTARWYLNEILDYIDDLDKTLVEYTSYTEG